jgi:hypothetical protein
MPNSLALQFPARGQYYTSADGAQTDLGEGIVYIVNDTVFSVLTNSQDPNGRLLTITIPAGITLNGDTTAFTVTSGVIYHGQP